jgi:hypothetical protein
MSFEKLRPTCCGSSSRRLPQAARGHVTDRGDDVRPGDDRRLPRLLAARRPVVRHRHPDRRGRPGRGPGRRDGKLGVMTLSYRLGTPASFDYAGFNGRGLDDDVMDVMLSLATNSALGDGVASDPARIDGEFPTSGRPEPRVRLLADACGGSTKAGNGGRRLPGFRLPGGALGCSRDQPKLLVPWRRSQQSDGRNRDVREEVRE